MQEALTNALKHAGPGARVQVQRAATAPDELAIEVADDGAGPAAAGDGGGHGLAGMRERVALSAASCDAGPRAGGGFAVRARLPLPVA